MATTGEIDVQFREWVRDYRLVFWKIARGFASCEADQADLVQEMQLHVWRALPSYRGDAKPSTWIYRVCLNTALAWRRGADRRTADHHDPHEEQAQSLASSLPDPGASAEQHDLLEQLYSAIRALPPGDRTLVLLHLDELAYDEIGAITGMTDNYVGVALTRARKKIAALMKGVTDELE